MPPPLPPRMVIDGAYRFWKPAGAGGGAGGGGEGVGGEQDQDSEDRGEEDQPAEREMHDLPDNKRDITLRPTPRTASPDRSNNASTSVPWFWVLVIVLIFLGQTLEAWQRSTQVQELAGTITEIQEELHRVVLRNSEQQVEIVYLKNLMKVPVTSRA